MKMLGRSGKVAASLAITVSIVGLFAIPQAMADSMAGSSATSETGGVTATDSSSRATTQSTTEATTSSSTQATSQNVSNSGGVRESRATSQTGDSSVAQDSARRGVTETGIKVRTSPQLISNRAPVVRSKVKKSTKKWKTVQYNWKNGKRTVVR